MHYFEKITTLDRDTTNVEIFRNRKKGCVVNAIAGLSLSIYIYMIGLCIRCYSWRSNPKTHAFANVQHIEFVRVAKMNMHSYKKACAWFHIPLWRMSLNTWQDNSLGRPTTKHNKLRPPKCHIFVTFLISTFWTVFGSPKPKVTLLIVFVVSPYQYHRDYNATEPKRKKHKNAPRPTYSAFWKACGRPLLRGAPSSPRRLRIFLRDWRHTQTGNVLKNGKGDSWESEGDTHSGQQPAILEMRQPHKPLNKTTMSAARLCNFQASLTAQQDQIFNYITFQRKEQRFGEVLGKNSAVPAPEFFQNLQNQHRLET